MPINESGTIVDDFGIPLYKDQSGLIASGAIKNPLTSKGKVRTSTRNLEREPNPRKQRKDAGTKGIRKYKKRISVDQESARKLQDIVDEIETQEKKLRRADLKPKSRAEQKQLQRQRQLKSIVNLTCPHCNKIKLLSKQWVVKDSFKGCKSCFWKLVIIPNQNTKEPKIDKKGIVAGFDSICPHCKKRKEGARQWIVIHSFQGCRSCFNSKGGNAK